MFATPSPRPPRSPRSHGSPRVLARDASPSGSHSPERTAVDHALHHRQRGGDEPWQWLGRAKRCSASGDNLVRLKAGEVGRIALHAHAALPANYRGVRTTARVQVLPRQPAPSGAPMSETDLVFEEWQAAAVDATYGPVNEAGEYLLSVTVEGGHINGSPFALSVEAGPAVAAASEVFASDDGGARGALVSSARAGRATSFGAVLRDRLGNRVAHGGDHVAVRFDVRVDTLTDPKAAADARVECEVADNRDGSYTVTYTAQRAGAYDATVLLDGAPVGGSSVLCVVEPGPTLPLASTVEGLAAADASAGEPFTFRLLARDSHGNRRAGGGERWHAELRRRAATGEAPDPDDVVQAQVRDEGDGTYSVSCVPRRSGAYEVRIFTERGAEVGGSPFELQVGAGRLDASGSSAYGPALDGMIAGEANTLYVTPADKLGNGQAAGPHLGELEVELTDAAGAADRKCQVYARAEDTRLHCQVVPTQAGTGLLHVGFGGAPVRGSPFSVHTRAGAADAAASVLHHASWRATAGKWETWLLEACDTHGNRCDTGGARVEVIARPNEASFGQEAHRGSVEDRGDGTYALTWRCDRAGVCVAHVTLGGEEVGGSPARILVDPGPADARATGVEEGTRLAGATLRANEWVAFLIIARDAHGNPTQTGGDEFAAACTSSTEAVLLNDWHDGRYEIRFCPHALGAHSIRVSLPRGGGDIVGSPFDFVVAPGPAAARTSTAHGEALDGVGPLDGTGALTIVARDEVGNRIHTGGDAFCVSVIPRTHAHYGHVHLFEDNGDGTYDVEFTTPVTGKYHVEVTLAREHIAGSPFPVTTSLAAPPHSPRSPLSPRSKHRAGSPPWPISPHRHMTAMERHMTPRKVSFSTSTTRLGSIDSYDPSVVKRHAFTP